MIAISDSLQAALEASGRRIGGLIGATLKGGGGINITYNSTAVSFASIKFIEQMEDSKGLSMGRTVISSCEITVRTDRALDIDQFMPQIMLLDANGSSYGSIRLGRFWATKTESNSAGNVITVTGYDRMSTLNETYVPSIDFPATTTAILADIVAQTGISSTATVTERTLDVPYEGTYRDWIGWLAGLEGKNARFSRDATPKLEFVYYSTDAFALGIGEDVQYMGGAETLTVQDLVVNSVTSGTDDNVIVSGNGTGISFTNPYMTQTILDGIYSNVRGLAYRPIQLEWRGNPALQCGDAVSVQVGDTSVPVLVMGRVLEIEGGMKDTLYCYGATDAQIALDTSPTAQRINQVYTQLQTAIANATAVLNGAQGGIFEITQQNGVNTGWLIKESADVGYNGNVIIANHEGIGFSHDGGATYATAILTDGSINADYITTGHINAGMITIGGEELTDVIYLGRRRPNDNNTPMVIRIGLQALGTVQEIMGNRTSMFNATDVQTYIDDTTKTDAWLNERALYYQTDTDFVMQRIDNIKLGNMRMQAQNNGGVSFVKA